MKHYSYATDSVEDRSKGKFVDLQIFYYENNKMLQLAQ